MEETVKEVNEESTLVQVSAKLKALAELFQDVSGTLSQTVREGIPFLLWDMAGELDCVLKKWGEETASQ